MSRFLIVIRFLDQMLERLAPSHDECLGRLLANWLGWRWFFARGCRGPQRNQSHHARCRFLRYVPTGANSTECTHFGRQLISKGEPTSEEAINIDSSGRKARTDSHSGIASTLQPAEVLLPKAYTNLSCVKPLRFRSFRNSRPANYNVLANSREQSAVSSCDVDEPACDLCAMSYGTLLLWAVG